MPVGKYDCDYCDKQFQDTPHARKRHLQSSSHLRAKSLWFSKNSNNNTLNSINTDAGGFVKGLCNRFVKTGFCPYGDSCKYLHANFATSQGTAFKDNVQSPNYAWKSNGRGQFFSRCCGEREHGNVLG
ncbi:hypothetical protein OIU78_027897 [Salix suchowensis]|uniref:NUCLEASE-RELATED n=1 Tax=Salix koriyanagi TaxID=2511006 RepID=A0A9Q0W0T3_9ROSI|nr:hypothetical protein OIU78_027897 [Salix suchowensis]KAJ6756985.1 NUCLEASE-RELATED [Salix koriyanagi]